MVDFEFYISSAIVYCQVELKLTKRLPNISGEKISPIEVDAVLLSHPDVAQAVAFGVPDDKYGEEVKTNLYSFLCLLNS